MKAAGHSLDGQRNFVEIQLDKNMTSELIRVKAVANSGGPDSTCLLFLLKSALSEHRILASSSSQGFFQSLVSLTVDHQFQSCSTDMSNHAARIATSLGVEQHTRRIPWSNPPYVAKPEPGAPLESIARDARYSILFEAMVLAGSHVISFGHHADDQVETLLMRLAKGTSAIGLSGMRPLRRFGMGAEEGKMGSFGASGMDRWIMRPLLEFPKVNLLTQVMCGC